MEPEASVSMSSSKHAPPGDLRGSSGGSTPPGTEASADGAILGRIRAGDLEAIGDLYDRYAAVLFPIALRIVRDRSEAEDVVHDAFVTVSDRAAQYLSLIHI